MLYTRISGWKTNPTPPLKHQPNSPPKKPQIQKYSLNPPSFVQTQKYIRPPKNKTPQNPHPKNKKNKKAAYSDRQPARRLASSLVFARGAKVGSFPPNPVLFPTP